MLRSGTATYNFILFSRFQIIKVLQYQGRIANVHEYAKYEFLVNSELWTRSRCRLVRLIISGTLRNSPSFIAPAPREGPLGGEVLKQILFVSYAFIVVIVIVIIFFWNSSTGLRALMRTNFSGPKAISTRDLLFFFHRKNSLFWGARALKIG